MDKITLLCEMVTGVFWTDYSEAAIESVLHDLNGVPDLIDDVEETTPIGHETDEQLMDMLRERRAEFVNDDPADMDEAAVRILMKSVFNIDDLEVA